MKIEIMVNNSQDRLSSVKNARMEMRNIAKHYIEGKQNSFKQGMRTTLNSYTIFIDESDIPTVEKLLNNIIEENGSLEVIINSNEFYKLSNKIDLNSLL